MPNRQSTKSDAKAQPDSFLEGVRLAAQMLTEGEGLYERAPDDACIEFYEGGEGLAQNVFVSKYLELLRTRPELTNGFAAVLSDKLGTSGMYGRCYADRKSSELRRGKS